MALRHTLSDAQWRFVEPHLPAPKGRGRPPSDRRMLVDGVLWIINTGAPWRDLPERFGPWQTVYDNYARWARDGTLDQILGALQRLAQAQGRLKHELWCIDGTTIRASRAAAGAPKKGAHTNPAIRPLAAPEVGLAPSYTCYVRPKG